MSSHNNNGAAANYQDPFRSLSKPRSKNYSSHGAIGEKPHPLRPLSVQSLDHLLSELDLGAVEMNRPSTVEPVLPDYRSASPLPVSPVKLALDMDPVFKNDLAHVLVWFQEDLTDQQRLSTVYTLAQRLSTSRVTLLIKCLLAENEEFEQYLYPSPPASISPLPFPNMGNGASTIPPSAHIPCTKPPKLWNVAIPEPHRPPGFHPSWTRRDLNEETQTSLMFNPIRSKLFYSNLSAWLRFHRLHKYEGNFSGINKSQILELDDADLAELGVSAVGARRKFLRLFEGVSADHP